MSEVLDRIRAIGVVPVVTIDDPGNAVPLGEALIAGGLPCVEITVRTPAGIPSIAGLIRDIPELLVGAGTILDEAQAREAVEAGSRFLVSPGLDAEVIRYADAAGVPAIPGVFTATEVMAARRLGCGVVKLFPAGVGEGRDLLAAFESVFPDVGFIPTGGITVETIGEYLVRSNVLACGGSWITPHGAVAAGDFRAITDLAAAAVEAVRLVRARS